MKKDFTNAAEELITGIAPQETFSEQTNNTDSINKDIAPADRYIRYIEPRSERMNILLSKSLAKKLAAEAKSRKMSKNGLINAILESSFSDNK